MSHISEISSSLKTTIAFKVDLTFIKLEQYDLNTRHSNMDKCHTRNGKELITSQPEAFVPRTTSSSTAVSYLSPQIKEK